MSKSCEEQGYVALSDDAKYVFIDGFGAVPIDWDRYHGTTYAEPVERQWVDLTDDEISDAIHGKGSPLRLFDSNIRDYRAVIAAFKDKNK